MGYITSNGVYCQGDPRFWFRKTLITSGRWAALPLSAKAVYPVICCHVNEDGEAYPLETTIARLAGITPKTARAGVKALTNSLDGFSWKYCQTEKGKVKWFTVDLPIKSNGRTFPFHRQIIDYCDTWAALLPTAKAIYPVLRTRTTIFDMEIYQSLTFEKPYLEGDDTPSSDFLELYGRRAFDFCNITKMEISKLAGVSRRHINPALDSLKTNGLLDKCGYIDGYMYNGGYMDGYMVFLRPLKAIIEQNKG